MLRGFVTVSSGTLLSRLLGFGRDAMVAALLGAGPIADAFLFAFQLVNVIRRLLTEGALNAALIPAWLRLRTTQGADAAKHFAGRVLGTLSLGLIVLTLAMGVAMPVLVTLLAPGFIGHATLDIAVQSCRLMLPYLAFAGPVAVLIGLQNAQQRFAMTAYAPVLFNLALIAAMAGLILLGSDAMTSALALSATVGLAGFLQLLMLVQARGSEAARPIRVTLDAPMRQFFGRAAPGMIASAGPQLLIVGGAIAASGAPAAVSWLYFANRLIELPTGIVSTAMGAVLVPAQARAAHDADSEAMQATLSRSLELAAGLALPAMAGLMLLSEPIVRLLFERGAFTLADSLGTAQAMTILAMALPAHVLAKTLSPLFYAREDTRTPMIAVLAGVITAGLAAYAAMPVYNAAGVAGAIVLGAWITALMLTVAAATMRQLRLDATARRRLPRIVIAALAMAALVWWLRGLVEGPYLWLMLKLTGLIMAAIVSYLAALALLGAVALRPFTQRRGQ